MKNERDDLMRIGKKFKKEINEIIRERWKEIDSNLARPLGSKRITEALVELPEWNVLKNKIIKAIRKEEVRR